MAQLAAVVSLVAVAVAGGVAWRDGRQAGPLHPRAPNVAPSPSSERARAVLDRGLATLDADLDRLATVAPVQRRAAFRVARRDYKQVEVLVAFYAPPVAAALNSPVAEEEGDEATSGKRAARGFQALEPALFPVVDRRAWARAAAELGQMHEAVRGLRRGFALVTPTDAQLLDAARLEVGRVSTLGIAGFDATSSGDAMAESGAALDGVGAMLPRDPRAADALQRVDARLLAASDFLRRHPDFVTFDRFTFVASYANPLFDAIAALRPALALQSPSMRRTWPVAAASIYDAAAFDPRSYGPSDALAPTPEIVALGRQLFFDPILSGDGKRACASCHRPDRAFTDGRPRARPFGGGATAGNVTVTRHTPSLINAAYQPAQFADERAASLEDQVAVVLASPNEMASSLGLAVHRLNGSAAYRTRMAQATGRPAGDTVTARSVQLVLAAYVRSLRGLGSPFDRALRGDQAHLTAGARRGFSLFMGKARCGTCHFAPLFNGTAPPDFVTSEVEVIGVPGRRADAAVSIDADDGRRAIDHLAAHAHAFKTPTVRNATLSAPYMHNGIYRTLDEVLDFYEHGGGAGRGARVPNQTLDARPLHLAPPERQDLIAFIASLADTTGLTGQPTQLPPLDGSPIATARAIGGTY